VLVRSKTKGFWHLLP